MHRIIMCKRNYYTHAATQPANRTLNPRLGNVPSNPHVFSIMKIPTVAGSSQNVASEFASVSVLSTQ